jgi:hypothetical protein
VTAARLSFEAVNLTGLSSPGDAIATIKQEVAENDTTNPTGLFRFSYNNLLTQNPWGILNNPTLGAGGFDCISLTILSVVQLAEVGLNATVSYAFATDSPDATQQRRMLVNGVDSVLDFYDLTGNNPNAYEGFLLMFDSSGIPYEAHTLAPIAGPIAAPADQEAIQFETGEDALHQITFSVIRNTLRSLQQTTEYEDGGQQWWLNYNTTAPVQSVPVPFPVSLNPHP